MDKMIIALNYKSVNNLDIGGSSSGTVRKRLPLLCFTSQTRTVQIQTDLITNVTIERFTHILNGEYAAEFSKIFNFLMSGYGRLEIDTITMFVKLLMEETLFLKTMFLFFFSLCVFIFSLSCFLKLPRIFEIRFQN